MIPFDHELFRHREFDAPGGLHLVVRQGVALRIDRCHTEHLNIVMYGFDRFGVTDLQRPVERLIGADFRDGFEVLAAGKAESGLVWRRHRLLDGFAVGVCALDGEQQGYLATESRGA